MTREEKIKILADKIETEARRFASVKDMAEKALEQYPSCNERYAFLYGYVTADAEWHAKEIADAVKSLKALL